MTTDITVDISEVLDKLDPRKMQAAVENGLKAAGDLVRADIKKYPGRQSSGPQQWKSERQRRWFFAALRRGEIQVPYRRTGKLGQSWTRTIEKGGRWPAAVIGTNRAYAPWVQDEERQAPMHARNTWPTAQGVARDKQGDVVRVIEQAI